jgi:hypothetical protein
MVSSRNALGMNENVTMRFLDTRIINAISCFEPDAQDPNWYIFYWTSLITSLE